MSSGGALPPTLTSPFNHFGYLQPMFPPQQHFFNAALATGQQRIKLKRQRQRVDAGEPRNSYQQARTNGPTPRVDGAMPCLSSSPAASLNDLFPNLSWIGGQEEKGTTDEELPPSMEAPEERDTNTDENEMEDREERAPSQTSGADSTASSNSSSSRRKTTAPKRAETEQPEEEAGEDIDELGEEKEWSGKEEEEEDEKIDCKAATLSAIQAQLNGNIGVPKINELLEAQKKLVEQQRKSTDNTFAQEINALAANIKKEIHSSTTEIIDRLVAGCIAAETARRAAAAVSDVNPLFPSLPSLYSLNQFPLNNVTGGIFPSFNPFMGSALSQMKTVKDEENKRKRKLETPSVRSKMTISPSDRDGTPLSDRASPSSLSRSMSSYFPPSMVNSGLYDSLLNGDSPFDSDDGEDCGPYDPNIPQSSTLTPMHLRKAKLMFFYTRYPNSSLLKQYFPDIRFNKSNTAQLVKWFSNFREFYYNQMDKYAKQVVAEGIQKREQIFVTKESEIFKQLNQHYNRNNHVEPPPRLVEVVQETLREFFDAIQQGRHNEPSWKKQIYKIICRLDDPIPDYFKDPNFLDRLGE